MSERKFLLATSMFAGLMMAMAGPAAAQDPNEVDELIVTGTRLPTTAFDSAAPVEVIYADAAGRQGLFDAAAILQTSPIAAGSIQQGALLTNQIQTGGPGVNTISLRGLGDQRTLVLMNGRRLGPAGVQGQVGAVDLNTLPSASIERYEILKDGASSIYGSDAVAGVVNIITRKTLDGGILTADGTGVQDGGGEEYRLSGAYGRVFDAGHFQVSAEWYRREALNLGDRPWLDCANPMTFDPTTGVRNDMLDATTGQPKCVSTTNNSIGYMTVYEAILTGAGPFPVIYGRRVPTASYGVGAGADPNMPGFRNIPLAERDYDPQAEDDATVISPVDRYTLFAEGSLERGGVEAYGEFLWSRRESEQKGYQTIFQPVSPGAPCAVNPIAYGCPGGSVLLPYPYANTFAATPGYGAYRHLGFAPLTQFLAPQEDSQRVDVTHTVVGARGDLAGVGDWKWDVYLSYSRSRAEYSRTGIYADRMRYVTGTDDVGNFLGLCPSGAPAGCTPLNFFTGDILMTGLVPQTYLDYLQIRETAETQYDQLIAEAVFTGTLFQAPAGPVGGAFGVSFRRDSLDDRPGPQAVAGNYWGTSTAGPTKGDDRVYEAFAEVGAPLTKSLTLNLSGRLSSYDSYGSNGVYKAGLNWRVVDSVRVRATVGTSFRAPALYEMSLNNQTGFLPQGSVDPCINWGANSNPALRDNCQSEGLPSNFAGLGTAASVLIGGGSDLEPEESTSRSIGAVWTPSAIGVKLAVDYWEVEIENEVTSLASAVVGQCYASVDFPDNPFCDLFTRRSTGDRGISFVDASYRNAVGQTMHGVDLTGRVARDLGPGRVAVDLQATWTLEDERELFAGRVDDVNGVIGEPEFVAQGAVTYQTGPWTATWTTDYIGSQSNTEYQFGTNCAPAGLNAFAGAAGNAAYCAKNDVGATWYHHASVRYEASGWALTGGVRNLFDEEPPFVSPAVEPDRGEATYNRIGNTPGVSQYDLVGRRVFVSLSKKF